MFNNDLSNCLDHIVSENKNCYISGDFNLDLLISYNSDPKVTNFVNNFYANSMFPLINQPTRITANSATILDNIFTNVLTKKINSGVCVIDITDHYPIFQITNSFDIKHITKSFCCHSFSQVNINCFKNHLQLTNWDQVLVETSTINVYNKYFDKLMDLYNKCFPVLRRCIPNANSRHIPRKPWITQAILKSIHRKDMLYLKNRSSQTESNKLALVNYKNSLTALLRAAKKRYFLDLLDEHIKNNSRQTWKVLNNLLGRNRKQQLPDSFDINGSPTSDAHKNCWFQ